MGLKKRCDVMKNIVFIMIIVINLALIYFGLRTVVTSNHLLTRNTQLETDLKEKDKAYQEEKKLLEAARKQYQDLETLQTKVQEELTQKKEEASELARQLAKEKQRRKTLERKLKKAEKRITSLQSEIDREKDKSQKLEERLERMATRLEKQDSDKQSLLSRLDNVIKERDAIQQQLKHMEERSPHYSLAEITVSEQKQYAGLVLNINEKFNFCIVSIGKSDGIVPGIELVVYRGTQLIGKIAVEKIFDKMSSAKIVSLSENASIQIEDRVRKF